MSDYRLVFNKGLARGGVLRSSAVGTSSLPDTPPKKSFMGYTRSSTVVTSNNNTLSGRELKGSFGGISSIGTIISALVIPNKDGLKTK
jgi:hypothetical protein